MAKTNLRTHVNTAVARVPGVS